MTIEEKDQINQAVQSAWNHLRKLIELTGSVSGTMGPIAGVQEELAKIKRIAEKGA
jgi:hypothetical protein